MLPEVLALRAAGWVLAPDAPVWAFLPAVWPLRDRTWIPDRATYYAEVTEGDAPARMVPWTRDDHAEHDADHDALAAAAGVPARPHGRLWLLRAPAGLTVQNVCDRIVQRAEAEHVAVQAGRPLRRLAEHVIDELWSERS